MKNGLLWVGPVLCGIGACLLVTGQIVRVYEREPVQVVKPFVEEVIPIFRTVKPRPENAVLLRTKDKSLLAIPKETGWKIVDVSELDGMC